MNPSNKNRSLWLALSLCLAILAAPPLACAQDVKALLSEANKELRQAQKDMFSGKSDKAIASLEGISELLDDIESADPNNTTLRSYQGKFQKLVKDLERKTGKDLGGGSLTAAPTSTATEPPPKAGVTRSGDNIDPLPYAARKPTAAASRGLVSIDGYIQRLDDPKSNKGQLIQNMEKTLMRVKTELASAQSLAGENGIVSHPTFDEISAGILAAEKKIARAQSDHAQAKTEADVSKAKVETDVRELKQEYDRVKDVFDLATGSLIYYNDLTTAQAALTRIDTFEMQDRPRIQPKLEAFAAEYGTTAEEIDTLAEARGYANTYYSASFAYVELRAGMENIDKSRTVTADDILRRAQALQENCEKGLTDFNRIPHHSLITQWGQTAAAYDPDNPRVKTFNSSLDQWRKDDLTAFNAKIDQASFPGNSSDAPPDVQQLSATALSFLQAEEDSRNSDTMSRAEILAVSVTGPWRIFKRNILGEPIQYNLPVAVAVQLENEKNMDLVRVYHMTMLTEEMKGVKKAPPYIGATVGNSHYARPSVIK